jgi:hypothetical protein
VLWRERRSRIAQAFPGLRDEQTAATLCAVAVLGQILVATFLTPTIFGSWFPARHLVAVLPLAVPLVALGLRWAPRTGAVLALLGVVASVWLYLDVRLGGAGLVAGLPDAPWGPLVQAFPLFRSGAIYPFVLAAAVGVAAIALVAFDSRHEHRLSGRLRG